MEQSSFVSARLTSPSNTQVLLGLSILYLGEFLRLYLGPVLSSGFSVLTRLVLPSISGFGTEAPKVVTAEQRIAEEAAAKKREVYKSQKEDRKASRGSDNDIYMLKTHGYNKHRFLSTSFIRRNKLQVKTDD